MLAKSVMIWRGVDCGAGLGADCAAAVWVLDAGRGVVLVLGILRAS